MLAMNFRNAEDRGNVFRAAITTLVESLRSPTTTTLIWREIPLETKSIAPEQEAIRAQRRDAAMGRSPARVPPLFKTVLLVVLLLTLGAGLAHVVMAAAWEHPTALQQSAFDTMETSWKTGFGALIGLLGGKAMR